MSPKDKVSLEQFHSWWNNPTTKSILEGFRASEKELVASLLENSNITTDPHLDRHVCHISGAIRAVKQLVDKQELKDLLLDYEILENEEK